MLADASATDLYSAPPPLEVAAEIIASLEPELAKFRGIAAKLGAVMAE